MFIRSASLILRSVSYIGPILCLRALYTARTLVNVGVSWGNINRDALIFSIAALSFAAPCSASENIVGAQKRQPFRTRAKFLVKGGLTRSLQFSRHVQVNGERRRHRKPRG
jgi:hypothetical protein